MILERWQRRQRIMPSLVSLSYLPGVLMLGASFALMTPVAYADPTDIVPRGSAILDAAALLARKGLLSPPSGPANYLGDALFTRAQLARDFKVSLLGNATRLAKAHSDQSVISAFRLMLISLREELRGEKVDVDAELAAADRARVPSLDLMAQPELRFQQKGAKDASSFTQYRATVLGDIGTHTRYVVSYANWEQEYRRAFETDISRARNRANTYSSVGKTIGYQDLNELYLETRGKNGLTASVGRINERWGAGYRGATLLSDNAIPFDQIQIAFPFSLGSHLGRDWRYKQLAATYSEQGTRKYYQARRIETNFTPRWSGDFQEEVLSTRSKSLRLIPFPFIQQAFTASHSSITKLFVAKDIDFETNYALNVGSTYQFTPRTRFYGQFFVDDLSFKTSEGGPRKIGYLIGGTAGIGQGTDVTLEYTYADPTTYTFRSNAAPWERNGYTLGQAAGGNAKELFGRISHAFTRQLTTSVQGRARFRKSLSFPAPQSKEIEFNGFYRLDARSGFNVWYRDFIQDTYPLASIPNPDANTPGSFANYGNNIRFHELSLGYQFQF